MKAVSDQLKGRRSGPSRQWASSGPRCLRYGARTARFRGRAGSGPCSARSRRRPRCFRLPAHAGQHVAGGTKNQIAGADGLKIRLDLGAGAPFGREIFRCIDGELGPAARAGVAVASRASRVVRIAFLHHSGFGKKGQRNLPSAGLNRIRFYGSASGVSARRPPEAGPRWAIAVRYASDLRAPCRGGAGSLTEAKGDPR